MKHLHDAMYSYYDIINIGYNEVASYFTLPTLFLCLNKKTLDIP